MTDALYDYMTRHSVHEHPAQTALREKTHSTLREAGMQISPDQGQFMAFLVRLLGARRALEVGTFTGYSALTVALALPPGGQLVACDVSEEYTSIGKPFWREAGIEEKIDLRIGPALATLEELVAAGMREAFDFAFIDADKRNYDGYYERCLDLVRVGGVIAFDNVLWGGDVAKPSEDIDTVALQALNDKLYRDERVDAVMLPIGDGLTLARRVR